MKDYGKIEIAKKLLKLNMSVKEIAEATGLTEAEIRNEVLLK